MSNRLLPLCDTDYWWLRYVLGIAVPIVLVSCSVYSLATMHSYAIWALRYTLFRFVPVEGEQAILMGIAYLGMAMMLFANCYAQYHEKMGYFYQWIFVPGILLAGGGILWCSWIFLSP